MRSLEIKMEEFKSMKIFYCFSSQLAGYLTRHGQWLQGTKVNNAKPQFDVFLFEDTDELRRLVDEYSKAKKH